MPWFVSVENEILQPRVEQWTDLVAEPDSTDFFRILGDLRMSADFTRHREALTARVWHVLDVVSVDARLREQLFTLAAHPMTCGDGVTIVFSNLGIHVLVFEIMASTTQARQPARLFTLARSLERLDQVEIIAQEDIAARLRERGTVDEAEVRLGYRVGLAKKLGLPAQPRSMLFSSLSGVTPDKLDIARRRILARESSAAFMAWLIKREFWMEYLEHHFEARFEPVKAPFSERLLALDSRKGLSDQKYLDEVAVITQERRAAVDALAISLSEAIAGEVLQEEVVRSDVAG